MATKKPQKRQLTWPESFLAAVVIVTFVAFGSLSALWLWTVYQVDKQLPGWVSSQVAINRIMIQRNEQANLQTLYLIGMEREIRNYRIAVSNAETKAAAERLENMIQDAVGGK